MPKQLEGQCSQCLRRIPVGNAYCNDVCRNLNFEATQKKDPPKNDRKTCANPKCDNTVVPAEGTLRDWCSHACLNECEKATCSYRRCYHHIPLNGRSPYCCEECWSLEMQSRLRDGDRSPEVLSAVEDSQMGVHPVSRGQATLRERDQRFSLPTVPCEDLAIRAASALIGTKVSLEQIRFCHLLYEGVRDAKK